MRARLNLSVLSLAATMFAAYSIICFHGASAVSTTVFGRIEPMPRGPIGDVAYPSPASEIMFAGGSGLDLGTPLGVRAATGAEVAPGAGMATAAAFAPIVPALMDYDYADKYLLQFIDSIPGYQLIEASISESRPPVYVVTLTGTGDQPERISYTNSPAKARAIAAIGKKAYFVPMNYKIEQSLGEQPSFNISFKGPRGEAIRWHFVLASEPTERGGGLTQSIPPLGFLHRRIATAAGEGTSVQIGDRKCDAKPWNEVSVVPYFVAYRGVYTVNSIVGGLVPGGQSWSAKSAPPDRQVGSAWVLAEGRENSRQFRIVAKQGDTLTIREVFNSRLAVPTTLSVKETPQGLAFNSIAYAAGKKSMRLTISPAFNVGGCPEGTSSFKFRIDLADQPKPAEEGFLEVQRKGNVLNLAWRATSPSWAKAKALKSRITLTASGYQISSWPDS
ncbi:MAG TPA: hypothetical protein VN345_03390 [Blastocatellia bacterium]|jgi:hypothetical protein|nr:hypothetical protein [Blastocatellia bacterium]